MKVIKLYPGRPPRWVRITIRVLVILCLVIVSALLLLQTRFAQEQIRKQLVSYLEKKTGSRVQVGKLQLKGFSGLSLTKILLFDRQNQPVLYSGQLDINFSLLPLLQNRLVIHELDWKDVLINVYTLPNQQLNYQYLLDAFATGDHPSKPATAADPDAANGFRVQPGRVSLANIKIRYAAREQGIDAAVSMASLHLHADQVDLPKQKFILRELKTDGLKGYLTLTNTGKEKAPPPTDNKALALKLQAKLVRVSQTALAFHDESSGISTGWQLKELTLRLPAADFSKMNLNAGYIRLEQARGYLFRSSQGQPAKQDATEKTALPFRITSPEMTVSDSRFRYEDYRQKKSAYPQAFDYHHFYLDPVNLQIKQLHFNGAELAARLQHLELADRSGFRIRKANANIQYNDHSIVLDGFFLETNGSRIANRLALHAPSFSGNKLSLSDLRLEASLLSTRLKISEVLYFVPELQNNADLRRIWNKEIMVNGLISGQVDDLTIRQLELKDNAGNEIKLAGRVGNVSRADQLTLDLNSVRIASGNSALRSWLPDHLLPDKISIPEQLDVSGRLSGGWKKIVGDLRVNSSYGRVNFTGTFRNLNREDAFGYDLQVGSLDMNIGRWLQDSSIGRVALSGRVRGSGLDAAALQAEGKIKLENLYYNGYNYQHISITGSIKAGQVEAVVASADSSLDLTLLVKGDLQNRSALAGKIHLNKIDLQALQFSSSPLLMKGELETDFTNTRAGELSGYLYATKIQVSNGKELVALDSILITAKSVGQFQEIKMESPFGQMLATGSYDYTQLPALAARMVRRHLYPQESPNRQPLYPKGQNLLLQASLLPPASLSAMLPSLEISKAANLEGRLNTDSGLLVLNLSLPSFRYDQFYPEQVELHLRSTTDSLNLRAAVGQLEHPYLSLHKTSLDLNGQNGTLNWNLLTNDKEQQLKYQLAGSLISDAPGNFRVDLAPELLLNRLAFRTGDSSALVIRNNQLADIRLHLQHDSQYVLIGKMSADSNRQLPLAVNINRLQVSTISGFLGKDSAFAEGEINADAEIHFPAGRPVFTGTVKADSIRLTGFTIGNIYAKIAADQQSLYTMEASITGAGNEISLQGTYADEMDLNLEIGRIGLAALEPFLGEQLTEIKGNAGGKLSISGKPGSPVIKGRLQFKDASGKLGFVGSRLNIHRQSVLFDERGIRFDGFTLTDTTGGSATLDGYILGPDLGNGQFDLTLNARDLMVLGPRESREQILYGPAFIGSKATITGNYTSPVVNMNVQVRDGSEIGFIVPDEEPGIASREGIVIFVDRDNPIDSTLQRGKDSSSTKPSFGGLAFSGEVSITPKSKITIVVDQVNGDFLEVEGDASLHVETDPAGNLSLTGKYLIESGSYEMSFNQLIKRSFSINKGSSIIWSGGPTGADIDITAKHTVNAPAIDLIEDQVVSGGASRTIYKQKVPVEVYLVMKGELMKPDIRFLLDMPEKERGVFNGTVYTRLKQINEIPAELNKQVMALLVLQTFLSENPLASLNNQDEGGIGFLAKKSVSKILSQQLNNLAGDLIRGIDLNFDLQTREDYLSGTREETTTLNVKASKTLFKDRLSITVGSNIELEGSRNNKAGDLIGDVLIDYALSRDGRYRLRAFQRNQKDAVLSGQIVETGLSFMLVMDFNEFRELFMRTKSEQQKNRK